jgi:hypothetical protein
MPYIEQMNYQSNRFFMAEGRIAGRNPVKEKASEFGATLTFTLTVGVSRMIDPNGTIEDEKGNRYSLSMHNLYCKIYEQKDGSNRQQVDVARTLRPREHVIIFGKIYNPKFTDEDGAPVDYTEYRVESIMFPERMASLLLSGSVDLSRIHEYEYVPNDASNAKETPGGKKPVAEPEEDYPF